MGTVPCLSPERASFLVGVAVAVVDGTAAGVGFRWAGVAAVQTRNAATFLGTVPINQAALDWSPEAPPSDWRALVDRWERLNTVRTWAAVLAFACFLTAVAVRPI